MAVTSCLWVFIISGAVNSYTNTEIVTEYVDIMKESLNRLQSLVNPHHESILQSKLAISTIGPDEY